MDGIVVCNRVTCGKVGIIYFIWYKDGKNVRTLCVMLSQVSPHRTDFDETKYIFFIKSGKLLEKYNRNWCKVSKLIKKEFDSESLYNGK